MFSVMYRDPQGANQNQIYFSPVIFNRSNTGRWHHVAVTYDNQSGSAVQYVDGSELAVGAAGDLGLPGIAACV